MKNMYLSFLVIKMPVNTSSYISYVILVTFKYKHDLTLAENGN